MRRRPELVPLSWEHHRALEEALRLRRTSPATLEADIARALAHLDGDGATHMWLEEQVVLPALGDPLLAAQVEAEHEALRASAAALRGRPTVAAARALGEALASHVRFEERIVLPAVEARAGEAALARVAAALR